MKARLGRAIGFAAALAVLAGCGPATLKDSHGYVPEAALLDEVRVGRDTKETVARLLGRPGTEGEGSRCSSGSASTSRLPPQAWRHARSSTIGRDRVVSAMGAA